MVPEIDREIASQKQFTYLPSGMQAVEKKRDCQLVLKTKLAAFDWELVVDLHRESVYISEYSSWFSIYFFEINTMTKNKKSSRKASYPCILLNQGSYQLVFFAAPAPALWKILTVNRRIEDKDKGYQRTLSPSRVRQIAKYIQEQNPIPLSILVSLDKGKYKIKNGVISFSERKDVGWVIDGQHRLAGAHESKVDMSMPVIAFLELPTEEQIKQFVVINREAKGVPTSLYYDLLKHLPNKSHGDRAKERAADIANQLKKSEESPFFGKIVTMTSPRNGEISLNIFVKKVSPLVFENKGILSAYSAIEQEKIIANYYLALANGFPKESRDENSIFFQTLGFGALFRILPTVFSLSLKHYKGFTITDVTKLFSEVRHFDFSDWKKYGTGNAAEIQAADDLRSELEKALGTAEQQTSTLRL